MTPSPAAQAGDGAATPGLFPIVGAGASAGGLEAFSELLAHLPVDTGMGFVLVQHLDPLHESALTQLLARATKMPVHEVTNELRVEPNHVYVIPPNTNLSIASGVLKLQPREQSRTPHRSIDFFLESLAADQRERAVGVILSGTATDGTLGLEAIKAEGGITFAQDDSAKYDSMPRSAAAAGCVDFVLAPEAIAKELARLARHPYVAGAAPEQTKPEADHAYATTHQDDATALPSGGSGSPDVGANRARAEAEADSGDASDSGFRRVLALLRNHCGVDFSLYKSSTIQRRIARRMLLCRNDTLTDYAQFLKGNAKELNSLFSDVLISVTSFFRNPDAFEVLQREVLPKLLAQSGDEPLRVWVLGCSTGQEAYSIAMSFVEVAEQAPGGRKLQVFATDLNDALLEKARHGLYAKSLAADLSPERLRRFFVEEGGGFRVSKPLREMVVFARQNLINDPPFSRIDIITCRNLLIYLEPSLQKKVFPLFHYALKPHGFLWLGASESIGGFTDLFEPLDRKQKIYTKKAASTPAFALPIGIQRGERDAPGLARRAATVKRSAAAPTDLDGFHAEQNAQREADRVTVNQFAPPGVLINAERQILQFRGMTGAYLQPPTGTASFDVLKMAREGLMLPLRSAIVEATKEMRAARRENVRIESDGTTRRVNVEVVPLTNLRERTFLVLFEDAERAPRSASAAAAPAADAAPARSGRAARSADKLRIAELERDLAETRDYLQAIQESHEASSEELQAASEEVQSANEELQSLNEELTTSKEELESSNEELSTVNQEMANRNAELSLLGNDLVNLQTSTHLTILLLGRDLTIRRFSVQAEKQFQLLAADIGRPIGNIRHRFAITDLEALITEVIGNVRAQERELQDRDGRWFSLRVRPYVTLDNKIDGAVLVLVDIDTLKRSEQATSVSEARYHAMFDATSVGVTEADPAGRLLRVNDRFARIVGRSAADVVGKTLGELTHPDDLPGDQQGLERLLRGEVAFHEIEKRLVRGDGTWVWVHVTVNLVRDATGHPLSSVAITLDITERKQAEYGLQESGRHKDEFLAMLAHELRNPLAPIYSTVAILRRVASGETPSTRLTETTQGDPLGWGLQVIERQVRQMARLIDDLLDVSRISRGAIELRREAVDLLALVQDVAQSAQPSFDSMAQTLCLVLPPAPVLLSADPTRLTQIIGNLLNNASKFTARGGRIELSVEPSGRSGAEVGDAAAPGAVIRVRDNGIGIAADQLTGVFRLFMQVDASIGRSRSGLGIGLALVDYLVNLHGGTVVAHSAGPGRGSEFVVRLPTGDVASAADNASHQIAFEPAAPSVNASTILVVDDNRDAAETLALWLTSQGFATHLAYDGLAAVAAAATLEPDVVVLDLGLPGIDGYEVARRIRRQPAGRRMMLVALTGWGQDGDRMQSKHAGFDTHLTKPLELDVFMKLLGDRDSAAAPD